MVARGDLGVQIAPERVPLAQKRIITLCNELGKPVITATQMLDSMIHNPRPTRAEAADVANAILDGTDCIMLSGETSAGNYPEEAVEVMNRIALETEASAVYQRLVSGRRKHWEDGTDLGQVIASAAVDTAGKIGASCIITPTLTGRTAQLLSKFRPLPWIVAASPDARVRRRLLLYPGVAPLEARVEDDSEAMIQNVIGAAIRGGFAVPGDKVVVAAGMPVHSPIASNSIRVHVIGTILARGTAGFGSRITGRIVRATDPGEASWAVAKKGGEILLTHTLDISFVPLIPEVAGIIVEGSSELSEQYMRGLNPNLVFVGQVSRAMSRFEENMTVTLDGTEMLIYEGSL
jgi:pyruvate kinase